MFRGCIGINDLMINEEIRDREVRVVDQAGEQLGGRLAVQHNLYFYNTLVEKIRNSLDEGTFDSFRNYYSPKLAEKV